MASTTSKEKQSQIMDQNWFLRNASLQLVQKRAFNCTPSFISVDLNDHKDINLWKIIVAAAVPAVAIAIIIFVVVFFTKRKNNNVTEECEMSAQSYIIPENDNELNAPLI